jgi:Tol biopolymer transport system component
MKNKNTPLAPSPLWLLTSLIFGLVALTGLKASGAELTVVSQRRLGSPPTSRPLVMERNMSRSGCHLVFVMDSPNGIRVVVDGIPGPHYDSIASGSNAIVFSPDGKRIAYVAKKKGKSVPVVDGKEGPEFDDIGDGSVAFSPDSQHIAYAGPIGGSWFIGLDGQVLRDWPSCEYIRPPVFSKDGKRLACHAGVGGKKVLIIDGKVVSELDRLAKDSLALSTDLTRYAYVTIEPNGKQHVIADGRHLPKFDGIAQGGMPIFSPNGQRMAYVAATNNNAALVVDENLGQEYDQVLGITFSPDGKRFACVVGRKKDDKACVLLDGNEQKWFDNILAGSPVFSPTGEKVAYRAARGDKRLVVVDSTEGPLYDGLARELLFSPDGSRLAYFASRGVGQRKEHCAVIEGKESPFYSAIGDASFSLDSKHFTYRATVKTGDAVIVDGLTGPSHAGIVVGPVFRDDGMIEYIAVERDGFYRVILKR